MSRDSEKEMVGREKNVNKLINELKNIRRSYDHYINRDKIKMLEKLIDNMLIDEEIY